MEHRCLALSMMASRRSSCGGLGIGADLFMWVWIGKAGAVGILWDGGEYGVAAGAVSVLDSINRGRLGEYGRGVDEAGACGAVADE